VVVPALRQRELRKEQEERLRAFSDQTAASSCKQKVEADPKEESALDQDQAAQMIN
jgi:hypothetical protein